MSLKENYLEVKNKVDKYEGATLIAVSKTKPVEDIKEVYEAGCRDFGENKVQEIMDKYEKLPADINWHMIGHLQTNKVKYIIDKVCLIHSVDSVKLASEIQKQASKHNLVMPILLEVNVAKEESKSGLFEEDLLETVKEIAAFPNVKIKGLMTVAPFTDNPEDNRSVFDRLQKMFVDINEQNIDNVFMEFLSMGMSGDYEVALSCGSTFVRVGTNIFGNRNYAI